MEYQEAFDVCQAFANKHKVIFNPEGEVGFGRPCAGFLHGDNYVDYCPTKMDDENGDYGYIKEAYCEAARPPESAPNAYHKHDCFAVLVQGDSSKEQAIIELANWVKHMESQGEVETVTFLTGATGIQALISGFRGTAFVVKKDGKIVGGKE